MAYIFRWFFSRQKKNSDMILKWIDDPFEKMQIELEIVDKYRYSCDIDRICFDIFSD